MNLIKLTSDYELKPFDCGDTQLNGFLMNDAKNFYEKKLAHTYLLEDNDLTMAYFSLLNDKISRHDFTNAAWRKINKLIPYEKHFSSYPAVKIGRFAIHQNYKGQGLGSCILTYIKEFLFNREVSSAFRFLTLDAYLSAVPFYEKNEFKMLLTNDENTLTRIMYFDILRM